MDNTCQSIKQHFTEIPTFTNIVMESSSVRYDTYRFLRDELKYKNVILSNLYLTKTIVSSKKKTDKIDTKILAVLLRGGYIVKYHMSDKKDHTAKTAGKIQKETCPMTDSSQKFDSWDFVIGWN